MVLLISASRGQQCLHRLGVVPCNQFRRFPYKDLREPTNTGSSFFSLIVGLLITVLLGHQTSRPSIISEYGNLNVTYDVFGSHMESGMQINGGI